MERDLISVIVPVYNVEPYLARCVDSIIRQTYGNLEIILVDDGSTDGSGEICDRYREKDRRIKVIHKQNGGAATARNEGLKIAKGQFVGFVDSDDYIAGEMYELLLREFTEGVDIVTCGTKIISNDKRGKKNVYGYSASKCILQGEEAITELVIVRKLSFSPCDKLFRHSLIKNIYFPENKECEDLPFCYNSVKSAKKIINLGKIMYFYCSRSDSTSRRTFHDGRLDYVIFSRDIFADVEKNYPKVKSYAFVMYIYNMVSIMSQMEECEDIDINLDDRYLRMRKALKKMLILILTEKKMPSEVKRKVVKLLFCGG